VSFIRRIDNPPVEFIVKPNSHPVKPARRSLSKDPSFVTALARGLDILRCFTPEQMDLGTSEIARLVGLPQPTVWRLCRTLTELGYLVRGATPDRLRVGAGVLLLGHAAITRTGICAFATPLMRQLADELGVSISLGQRVGHQIVVVQRVDAPGILRLNLHVGSSLDLAQSSLGWAYLAALEPGARKQLLVELKAEAGRRWSILRRDIENAMADYDQSGLVSNLGISHAEINAIGVPVISQDRQRIMALTCGGAKSVQTRERLLHHVAPALKRLAHTLGPMASQDQSNG
jgi:DNA-binding IclR family transcriptional regulator